MGKDKEQVFITAPGFPLLPLEETLETLVRKYGELEKQLKSVQQERDKWENEARLQFRLFNDYQDEVKTKVESLQRDKAELIEVLEYYANGGYDWKPAANILSRMKGEIQ